VLDKTQQTLDLRPTEITSMLMCVPTQISKPLQE